MLTLVTYNLYKGGAPDYSAFGRVLTELSPDILLLQEVSKPELYLENAPADLKSQVASAHWGNAGTNYWGSAIYMRQGILTELPIPDALQGWVTAAEVDGQRGDLVRSPYASSACIRRPANPMTTSLRCIRSSTRSRSGPRDTM